MSGTVRAPSLVAPAFAVYLGIQLGVQALGGTPVVSAAVGAVAVIALYTACARTAAPRTRPGTVHRHVPVLAFLLLLVWTTGQVLANLVWQVFPAVHAAYTAHTHDLGTAPAAVALILSLALGPAAEEVLFRGILYRALREGPGMGPVPAALASAAVFAIMHGDAVQIVAVFGLGMLLALAYERAGSLWVPVLLHAAFNALAVTVPASALRTLTGPAAAALLLAATAASLPVLGIVAPASRQDRVSGLVSPDGQHRPAAPVWP